MAERVQAALGGAARIPWDVAQEIVVRACFVRSRQQEGQQNAAVPVRRSGRSTRGRSSSDSNLAAFITATITEHQGVTSLEYDGGVDAAGRTIDIPAELRGSAAGALFAEGDEDALPAAVLRCLKK